MRDSALGKLLARSPFQGIYRPDLACRLVGIEYSLARRTGVLWLAHLNCTDMQGAITLFQAIDPDVERIFTVQASLESGMPGIPDTAYIRRAPGDRERGIRGQWTALRNEDATRWLSAAGLLPLLPPQIMQQGNG